jgi:hypothetical protein
VLPLVLLAVAQPPADAGPSATAVLTGEAVARAALPPPPHDEGQFDLLIGLPTAVRYLHPLRGPLWAEVGAGVYVIIPDVFAGLRCDLPVYRGGRDRFVLRPGVAAHAFVASVFTGGNVLPSLSADVELAGCERGGTGRCIPSG